MRGSNQSLTFLVRVGSIPAVGFSISENDKIKVGQ